MNNMERRRLFLLFAALPGIVRAGSEQRVIRGKLTKAPSGSPAIQTADGGFTALEGDSDTLGVLNDARLAGSDFEVVGQTTQAGAFTIAPIHTRALFTYK